MSERLSDELLSAYFDGDVSPREREQVERWLAQSPEARRELAALGRTSRLLRSLPVAPAPDDLVSAVMQQAERATLLPPVPPARPVASRRRAWLVAAGGLAVTAAAALLLLPLLSRPHPEAHGVARLEPSDRNAETDGDHLADRGSAPAGVPPRTVAMPENLTTRRVRPAPDDMSRAEADPNTIPLAEENLAQIERPADPPAPATAAGAAGGLPEQQAQPGLRAVAARTNWGAVQIGDVVPYFETSGDRAAVVKMTVVDIHKAVDTLQVLLAKNEVPPVGDEEEEAIEADALRRAFGGTSAETADGRLTAVYVESTDSQLASTLQALEADEQFLDLELRPPVPLEGVELAMTEEPERQQGKPAAADLSTDGRETLQEAVSRSRTLRYKAAENLARPYADAVRKRNETPAAQLAERPDVQFRSQRANADRGSQQPGAPEPAAVAGDDAALARNVQSFQMLVNVPQEELGRLSRSGGERKLLAQRRTPAPGVEPGRPAPPFFAGGQPPEQSAVRVIFVFQKQDEHSQEG